MNKKCTFQIVQNGETPSERKMRFCPSRNEKRGKTPGKKRISFIAEMQEMICFLLKKRAIMCQNFV